MKNKEKDYVDGISHTTSPSSRCTPPGPGALPMRRRLGQALLKESLDVDSGGSTDMRPPSRQRRTESIDGERIVWVLARVEGQGANCGPWKNDSPMTNTAIASGLLVRADGPWLHRTRKRQRPDKLRFQLRPAHPLPPTDDGRGKLDDLHVPADGRKLDFTLPSEIITERLADETGDARREFADCRHYRIITTSTINLKIAKIPFTEEREQWYHPTCPRHGQRGLPKGPRQVPHMVVRLHHQRPDGVRPPRV